MSYFKNRVNRWTTLPLWTELRVGLYPLRGVFPPQAVQFLNLLHMPKAYVYTFIKSVSLLTRCQKWNNLMRKRLHSDKEGDKLETISKMSPQTTHSDAFSLEEETKKIDNMTIFSVHKTPSQEINLKIKNSINI